MQTVVTARRSPRTRNPHCGCLRVAFVFTPLRALATPRGSVAGGRTPGSPLCPGRPPPASVLLALLRVSWCRAGGAGRR